MSTSRDVKTLFDRFGGDATSYREIRMENEASDARGRWPLLSMTAPRKLDLHAAGLPSDHSQAALRRLAPLFAHSPCCDVPPVIEAKTAAAPKSSTFRFSPSPVNVEATEGMDDVQPDVDRKSATCEPVEQPLQAARTLSGFTRVPVSTGAAPLRKLFGAPGTLSQAGCAQPSDAGGKSVSLDTLFDRLRGGGAGAEPGEQPMADALARPWYLGGAAQQ